MIWRRAILLSAFPPAAVLGKIAHDVPHATFSWHPTPDVVPFVGRTTKDGFVIKKTKSYINPLGTIVRGRVVAEGNGSKNLCDIGPNRFALGFVSLWMLVAIVFSLRSPGFHTAMVCAGGIAFIAWCLHSARGEGDAIVAMLQALLKARPAQ